MDQFQPSQVLQALISEEASQHIPIAAPFIPIQVYQRDQSKQQQQQTQTHEQLVNMLGIPGLLSSSNQHQDNVKQKKYNTNIQEKYNLNVNEQKPQIQTKFQPIQQEEVAIDEEAYESMMKPDNIADIPTQNNNTQTLLQALQSNQFTLLQFPTLLPFEQVYESNKVPTKYIPQVIDDVQEQLKEYHSVVYDSAGFPQKKQFKQFLEHKSDKEVGIKLGKIRINEDGTAKWMAGKEVFDITPGVDTQIKSTCVAIDDQQKSFAQLGSVQSRFIIKPNIDNLPIEASLTSDVIFEIPYFYIIVVSVLRYYMLKQQSKTTRPSLANDDEIVDLSTPISYSIKIVCSIAIAVLHLLQAILGDLGCILPILAQIMSVYLLQYEYKQQIKSVLWTHAVYWPFQATFLFLRMVQYDQQLQIRALIATQLVPAAILLVYGLYRPNDRDKLPDETPNFVRELMKLIENARCVQALRVKPNQTPLLQQQPQRSSIFNQNVKKVYEEFRMLIGTQQEDQEQFLVDKLPEHSVTITRKAIKRFVNDNEIVYLYQCVTTINDQIFQVERRYPEFLSLERQQHEKLSKIEQTAMKLSRVELKQGEDEMSYILRRRDIVEQWLQDQFADPMHITNHLLEFLQVDEQNQVPFLLYWQLLIKKSIKSSSTAKKRQQNPQEQEVEMIRFSTCMQPQNDVRDYSNIQFSATCNSYEYGQYGPNSVDFVINVKYNNRDQEGKYRILKSLSSIKQLISTLEGQLGRPIPFSMKAGSNLKKAHINERISYVDGFMRQLLENQEYYCDELFEFIGFDVEHQTAM